MKKHISEELPARKFKPSAAENESEASDKKEKGGGDKVRQAVYDIRYRARREEIPLQTAFSQYMANSSMGMVEKNAVRAKLFGESYDMESAASATIAKALYQVFIEKKEDKISENDILRYFREDQIITKKGERKYKVEVVGKDGRSYVRYATREKINDLRLNPNIKSVEMTDKGEPYEGERSKGEYTAKVKAGKDWDGDGKVESGSKEHAGVVHNAIQRAKGGVPDGKDTRKESVEFIGEVKDEKEKRNKKIDVMKGKNKCDVLPSLGKDSVMSSYVPAGSIISETVMSDGQLMFHQILQEKAVSQNQQQLAGMALAYLRGEMPNASDEVKKMAKMGETELRKFAKTKHKGLPEKVKEECESDNEDTRDEYAKKNVIKNRIRAALGVKNPILLSVSKEETSLDEGVPLIPIAIGAGLAAGAAGIAKSMKKDREEVTGSGTTKPGTIKNSAQKRYKEIEKLTQSYEPEGEIVDEGKAIGKARSSDENPKGHKVRVSSGRGMTMTKAAGLGKEKKIKNNPAADDLVKKHYDSQVRSDRRAAAKERASSGDDKISRLIRSIQKNNFEFTGELVDEGRGEFRSLGRPDRNDGRNRYMGSPTPEQEKEDKKREDDAAARAKARLRRAMAREKRN